MAVLEKEIGELLFSDKELALQVRLVCATAGRRPEVFCAPDDGIQLHYVQTGRMEMLVDGKPITAEAGDMMVLNSGSAAKESSISPDTEQLVVTVSKPSLLFGQAEGDVVVFRKLMAKDPEIARLMEALYSELTGKKPGYLVLCRGLILQLSVWLLRQYRLGQEQIRHRMGKQERIKAVRQYIDEHYMEAISIPKLAELIHVSESRLIHLFKDEMGVPPLKHINAIRLHKAKQLLEEDEYSVMEVAAVVGFSDYNHFGRMFRERFGCTPIQARKNAINSRNI